MDKPQTTPPNSLDRKWKVDESDPFQITIITADEEFRVCHLCHSGFGVSVVDREIAKQIVEDHNARI